MSDTPRDEDPAPLWLPPPPAPEEPPAPAVAPWGLKGALLMILAVYGGQLLLALALGALAGLMLQTLQPSLADDLEELREATMDVALVPVILASTILTLALVWASVRLTSGRPLHEALMLKRPSGRGVAVCLLLGAVLSLVYLGIASTRMPDAEDQLGGPLSRLAESGPLGHALWIFLGLGVAPVVEEIVFRGYIYLGARRTLGPAGAGALVSGVFTVLHMGETGFYWPALAGIATVAIVLVVIMERTRNLTYCIATHLGYNATLAALSVVALRAPG